MKGILIMTAHRLHFTSSLLLLKSRALLSLISKFKIMEGIMEAQSAKVGFRDLVGLYSE